MKGSWATGGLFIPVISPKCGDYCGDLIFFGIKKGLTY
jgi:hypothetical protein